MHKHTHLGNVCSISRLFVMDISDYEQGLGHLTLGREEIYLHLMSWLFTPKHLASIILELLTFKISPVHLISSR